MRSKIEFTKQFRRDDNLAAKQHRDLERLFEVVDSLQKGETLDSRFKDHELTGQYKGTRECHIQPDFLLVYKIKEDVLVLLLYRVGTHSSLFKK